VAIPATMIHNGLARRAEVLIEQWRAYEVLRQPVRVED